MIEDDPLSIIGRLSKWPPPIMVGEIARELHLRVNRHSLGEHISGQIIRDPNVSISGFKILINSDMHVHRQRFSLAHEIAHYVLHRDLIEDGVIDDTMYRSMELGSNYEKQANQMASDILMPIRLIKYALKEWGNDVTKLAEGFWVSQQAMEFRLKSIVQN